MSVPSPSTLSGGRASGWFWAALCVAVAGAIGSLSLSLVMNLKACPLCFYQRAFVMAAAAVLVMQMFLAAKPSTLLALPLAFAGLGVAAFHVSLELRGKLECPAGLFGIGTAPQQSLALFLLLAALMVGDVLRSPRRRLGLTLSSALGALLAVGSTIANPPPPAAPERPYEKPPEICRPPHRAS